MSEFKLKSRRKLLSSGAAVGLAALLDLPASASAENRSHLPHASRRDVTEFGALGNAKTHDSAAFQRALDTVSRAGGGTVFVPPGKYLLENPLNVPDGVTLQGSYQYVPSHTGLRDRGQAKPGDDGTALLVTAGRGQENGQPFLSLNSNSTLCGLTIYYPEQVMDNAPVPYPWTVQMRGKNPAVLNVELLNPYQGIDASKNERHNIRNVTGQPLSRGIWVDAIYDIGRIENVHFNPWWNSHSKVYQWQMQHGEAFIFGRSDWEYVLNTFCFGYHIGYRFVQAPTGSCNGNFLGIGADDCNRAIRVEQCTSYALLITNGEFTSFRGPDPTMVEVMSTNEGVVRLNNCAFWGPCDQISKIAGKGTVGFDGCTFVQWGRDGSRAAIQAASGSLLVSGCEFLEDKPHILLGENLERAVITGNLFKGPAQIQNHSRRNVQIGLNAESV